MTEGSFINLKECKKDIKDTLNPVSMAFISVTNHGQIIYEGWIFSKNTSIALPKIDDGLIEAVFLKLGTTTVHHKRNKMTLLVLLP